MNVLFVLYGDFGSNSAIPLALYARELHSYGHRCAVAVPSGLDTVRLHEDPKFRPILFTEALAAPESAFSDGRAADVIHACTPREIVRRFVTSYMSKRPTPFVIYLEDNEAWIAARALGLDEAALVRQTEREIAENLPEALSNPFSFDSFIGLADAVAVIQDKLRSQVPPWLPCETVTIGVDLGFFSPRAADPMLRKQFDVADDEKIIVYHGGMNQFTRPGIATLCRAVGLINQGGYRCRLLRSGPMALDFLGQLPDETAAVINDIGMLPRHELPDLLALADVFVQPGEMDPFEDLRLPGKVPEFLAMERPVVLPDANIAYLLRDGIDAVILRTGSAEEIATKCIELFVDPQRASEIGRAGRKIAERHFDVRSQARLLERVYDTACESFDSAIAMETWHEAGETTPTALLLARKMKLIAASNKTMNYNAKVVLAEHARFIELMQRRITGLEAAIAERDSNERNTQILNLRQQIALRDRQIADFKNAIDGLLNSYSWRLTLPLRKAKAFLVNASQRAGLARLMGRAKRPQ